MKPIARNRKVSLQFMDVKVSIEGNYKNIDQRAYSLMAALVGDRMRMAEIMAEMSHEDEEHEPVRKSKKKTMHADIEFLKMYA